MNQAVAVSVEKSGRHCRAKVVVIAHEGRIIDAFFRTEHDFAKPHERAIANALWGMESISLSAFKDLRGKFRSLEQFRVDRERARLTARINSFHQYAGCSIAHDVILAFRESVRRRLPPAEDARLGHLHRFLYGDRTLASDSMQSSKMLTIDGWRGLVVVKILVVER